MGVREDRTNIEQFTLQECKDYLIDEFDLEDMPNPNPWTMDREDMIDMLNDRSLSSEITEELQTMLIEHIDNCVIDGLDQWRQACLDAAEW